MVDTVQLVLLIVIVVLTVLLVILGIQVYHIFKELRTTLKKTNRVLDNADSITSNIEGPLSALSSLALGTKAASFLTVAKFVKNILSKDKDTDERRKERE
jgi:predicted PurR-regulated permease PerM